MKISELGIKGLFLIELEPFKDERGFFTRVFCQKELSKIRDNIVIEQINHSMTKQKGTIRGMHFQYPPHAEMKIVRCTKGSIFDVAIDIRKNSPTFLKWHGEILSAENMKSLVIPEGFAHGFQSLEDDVEMIYLHTSYYSKEFESGICYNDKAIGINWSLEANYVSKKDINYDNITDTFIGIDI